MNALKLFKNLLLPHLWLNHNIGIGAGMIGASAIGALGGLLGGGGSDGAESISGFAALPKWLKQEYKNNLLPEIQNSYAQGPDSFFPGQTFVI